MGKMIKDGFAFMAYANAGLIRKVEDIPLLKTELITISEGKTHLQMSRYAVLLGRHILDFSGVQTTPEMEACLAINAKWQAKQAKFQDARDTADVVNRLARDEKDPVKTKVLRAFGQVAATPHVKWHALVASEYAVVITNLLYPKDFDKVKREREWQIECMKGV